jgi:hypothetical protein
MAESRCSDSNVELNNTQINQMLSPMYSHPEESNYMKKIANNYKIKHAILTSGGVYFFIKKLFQDINANIFLL